MKRRAGATEEASLLLRVARFYGRGFRRMRLGRTLWKVIVIKLFIIFAVLKLFFFPDFLGTKFSTDGERAHYVLGELSRAAQPVRASLPATRYRALKEE